MDPATSAFARTQASKGRCHALATDSAAELLSSNPISEDARAESSLLSCELAAGHDSDHLALLATAHGDDQWWWLRWDEQLHEVIQIDPCDAELTQGRYADECFLPEGHPGPHDFELPQPD